MKIYLVGGAVRDRLLGLSPTDLDYVVVGSSPQEMLDLGYKEVGADFPVFLHPETGEEYALARKEYKEGKGYKGFKCTFGPEVTLEEDLERRDLTINAMAESVGTKTIEIIDPFNGQEDLKKGIIRHTSDAFAEDPLRVLRAARFAARFSFVIDGSTRILMERLVNSGELNELTSERVWIEVEKALKDDNPTMFFKNLRMVGALKVILPELERLHNVPQPVKWHPEGDALTHTFIVLDNICKVTKDPVVRFAALCHDLGKGLTAWEDLPSHPGHELKSADMVKNIAKRLKLPSEYKDLAYISARFHLKVHKLKEMKPKKMLKLLKQTDAFRKPKRFRQFLDVCYADACGKVKQQQEVFYDQGEVLQTMLNAVNAIDNLSVIAGETRGHVIQQLIHNAQLSAIRTISNK